MGAGGRAVWGGWRSGLAPSDINGVAEGRVGTEGTAIGAMAGVSESARMWVRTGGARGQGAVPVRVWIEGCCSVTWHPWYRH